jgi:hypothetical protein
MKKVSLPSGATLSIGVIPFKEAKALYQALLKELKEVTLNTNMQVGDLLKDLFCISFSSPEIERALWACLSRCLYGNGEGSDLKITEETFEPVAARDDYMKVCVEVTKEAVNPFAKSLYAEYRVATAAMPVSTQA